MKFAPQMRVSSNLHWVIRLVSSWLLVLAALMATMGILTQF
jgi:hypothetical protein